MTAIGIGICAGASFLTLVFGLICYKYDCPKQTVQPIVETPKYEAYKDCPPQYEDPSTMT